MPLPECYCWTRFGTEAGQSVDQILARKEQERAANAGVFFWGIGNAIGPSMIELLRRTESPEAVFSPIRSVPRRDDSKPASVVVWTSAETLAGEEYRLPQRSLITSRLDPRNPRNRHYALVCYSESPITISLGTERVQFADLRNLLTGRPVGASQVTAVVYSDPFPSGKGIAYNVAFRVQLAPPYFISLGSAIPLVPSADCDPWAESVRRTWDCKAESPVPGV
jgi:hypothetical protein